MSRYATPRDVPQPPVPADPLVCRWCNCRCIELSGGAPMCPSGCAANDAAPYLGHCTDCGTEYYTGRPMSSDQCWPCESRERGITHRQSNYRLPGHYTRDRVRRGVMRDVVAHTPEKGSGAA